MYKRQEEGVFPTQIIVIDQLTAENNFWLSRLRKNLTAANDIEKLAEEYRKKRNSPLYSAAMDLLMRANHEAAEEAKDMCDAIRELFADELKEVEKQERKKGIDILTRTCRKLGRSREETRIELEESYGLSLSLIHI